MEHDAENGQFPHGKIYFGLYVRNIGANLLGFAIILVLNFFTPMGSDWLGRTLFVDDAGWYLVGLFPFILLAVAGLQYWFQCPVYSFLSASAAGKTCTKYSEDQVKRRVLNLPVILASANLAVYIIVPFAHVIYSSLLGQLAMEPRIVGLLFFRSVMIGLITASLSFFIVENYTRHVSIPLIFPEGGLTEVPGAVRVNVMRRIRLLNLAGTLTPMLILVVTLAFVVNDPSGQPGNAAGIVREIFFFTLVLCVIFIVIAFRLSILVGRSVVEPIEAMLRGVKEVERGDFSTRIRVASNDELGVLADAGNRMIQGLAEHERVRESFGRYVTPEIRDKILSGEVPLNGEKKIATILFADLRDFTAYVEGNSPEEVILSMRDYFTKMEEAVGAHGGLALQFVGDEMEAVFGVPLEIEDHADRAVKAALEMRRGLANLNEKRRLEGKPPFAHGVGICSGPVLAGNTGSRNHPSYALIGDTVNTASRIQELTKEIEADILISGDTRNMLKGGFNLRSREMRSVKGYKAPVEIYEVTGN